MPPRWGRFSFSEAETANGIAAVLLAEPIAAPNLDVVAVTLAVVATNPVAQIP
jgi:hypothetical protein